MKLLLIEDEKDLANSMISYLTTNDFVCEWGATTQAAIDKISNYEYDCILLDLMLPDGDGFSVLQELKKAKQNRRRHHYFGQRNIRN